MTAESLTPAPLTIPGWRTFLITPPNLGVTLRITVAQPVMPVVGGDTDAPVAIVYATDADYLFGTVADAVRVGSYGGDLAPAAVVGIGYADETGDLSFVSARRFHDFYRGPRRTFDAGAYGRFEFGGADEFLAALKEHVIPAVEQLIGNPDAARRVLLGTSAGGHFAAYALAQAPELFQGYAMMSPMLVDPKPLAEGKVSRESGEATMVRMIEDLPAGALPAGRRVFLSAGSLEEDPGTMFADFHINSNALRMRVALAQHGVETELVQFADESHGSVTGAATRRALRFLLPPVAAKADWQAALAGDSSDER